MGGYDVGMGGYDVGMGGYDVGIIIWVDIEKRVSPHASVSLYTGLSPGFSSMEQSAHFSAFRSLISSAFSLTFI